ncbi:hypothetical protein CHUAL_005260 [Chamberlinius hualienensis]
MFTLILFTCLLSGYAVSAADPKDGLGCKTQGDFVYCEGTSPTYKTQADTSQLSTRSHDLLTRNYGMKERAPCDPTLNTKCQQVNSAVQVTYLVNSNNQPRYILQDGAFKQIVQISVCSGKVCGQYGFCQQDYLNVQLLSWDPFAQYPDLLVDTFSIPSCCKCRRGGPGGSWN